MARFAVADSQDQTAPVWVMCILLLFYTTLTTLIRVAIKRKMICTDDYVALLAQLLAYGNAFNVIYALVHGLARTELDDQIHSVRLEHHG
jgi:hypothetical protein